MPLYGSRLRRTSASWSARQFAPDASSASVMSVLWQPNAPSFARTSLSAIRPGEFESPWGRVTSTVKRSGTCVILIAMSTTCGGPDNAVRQIWRSFRGPRG
jgi:hypothetical protein